MALPARHASMKRALLEYLLTDRPLVEIAKANSYTVPAISYWMKKLKLERRHRGRRPLSQPTAEHQRILELVRSHGVAEAARRTGVSRQRISEVVCRWGPKLKRRRAVQKLVAGTPRKRRVPRDVIVSFRISTDEWKRLLSTEPKAGNANLSGFDKARAIVLGFLDRSEAENRELRPPTPTPIVNAQPADHENVYKCETDDSVCELSIL
jgi:hypothetical protein